MKMIRLNSLVAILIAIVMMSSCKKESSGPEVPDGYALPGAATKTEIVKVPSAITNSQDANLAYASGMIQSLNAYSGLMASFKVPAGAELVAMKGTTKTWKWTSGQFQMWVEYTEGDVTNKWVLYYQDNQTFVTKTKIIEATETILGNAGTIKIFYGQVSAIVTYAWEKTGSTTNATCLYSYGGESILMTVSAEDSGAGEFDIYDGATTASPHAFHVEWNAQGHGSWWYEGGTTDPSGTF